MILLLRVKIIYPEGQTPLWLLWADQLLAFVIQIDI